MSTFIFLYCIVSENKNSVKDKRHAGKSHEQRLSAFSFLFEKIMRVDKAILIMVSFEQEAMRGVRTAKQLGVEGLQHYLVLAGSLAIPTGKLIIRC